MTDPNTPTPTPVDDCLDCSPGSPQRRSAEARIAADPALRAELEAQRRIDAGLRRMFAVPAECPVDPAQPAAQAGSTLGPVAPAGRFAIPRWLRVAAVIAILVLGAWLAYAGGAFAPPVAANTADTIYKRFTSTPAAFEPAWVCKDDNEFIDRTKQMFGQSFVICSPAGMEIVGWNYTSGLLGDDAGVLLVKVNGTKVIVVADKIRNDHRVTAAPASGVNVFRQRMGSVVFYEVSPNPTPAVLPRISRFP